tara:strand:+ start:217293 stop:218330 length:1038 start_codon:yes stop_codon:yes gene_type:complete
MSSLSINKFDYKLSSKLIANKPIPLRQNSKLLYLNTKEKTLEEGKFKDICSYMQKGDILILNNTKVIPGRMILKKETGGKLEILYSRIISKDTFEAIYTSSRPPKVDTKLFYTNSKFFIILKVTNNILLLKKNTIKSIISIMKKYGKTPLPKYIKRSANIHDQRRYQTVYAKKEGSIAAPTAGLHFTRSLLSNLKKNGVIVEYITLHISYNTFKPIKHENYTRHNLGSEYCMINKSLINKIKTAKEKNKKIIAVGTTVARTLEGCASLNISSSFSGYIDLFIKPGYKFKVINHLITNFHLPKSTLLLLVCAFAGKKNIFMAYKHAMKHNYRFYSYGDCMFINNQS